MPIETVSREAFPFFRFRSRSSTCGTPQRTQQRSTPQPAVTLAAVLEAAGNVRVAMQLLGFRFDEHAVLLDGTAHRTYCALLPVPLPGGAVRLCAAEVLRAQRCPRECICAPPFETLLTHELERPVDALMG